MVPHCAGGIVASLIEEPEIIEDLPPNTKSDMYSERLTNALKKAKEIIVASYFHNCTALSQTDCEQVLKIFRKHYDDYKNGLPGADLGGVHSTENEIIQNLIIATNNIVNNDNKQLLSKNSSGGKASADNLY